jgi:hypothetical protein
MLDWMGITAVAAYLVWRAGEQPCARLAYRFRRSSGSCGSLCNCVRQGAAVPSDPSRLVTAAHSCFPQQGVRRVGS